MLGVSSVVNAVGRIASYSNDDDFIDTPDDGIGAFGGDADDLTGMTTDGIVGLYVSPRIPPDTPDMPARPGTGNLGGPANTRGWASWSGTSFAAPIAAGFAACLWSAAPFATAREIMNLIITEPRTGSARAFLPFFQV